MNDRPSSPILTRQHIFAAVFFALFILLLYQAGRLIEPFLSALLWAGVLSLAFYPAYRKVLALFRGRAALASGVMTLLLMLVLIGPSIPLLTALTAQAIGLYQWASGIIETGRLAELWSEFKSSSLGSLLAHPTLAGADLKGVIVKGLGEFSSSLAAQIGTLLKNTLLMTVNILIMIVALFFFFKDGESHYTSALGLLPFTAGQKQAIARKFHDTFSAVITGVFFIALVQGLMTGLGLALFGIPYSVFWGVLAAVLALLPVGGAALVWVPAALYLFLTGETLHGILFAVWGTLLVSLPDNFLKPLLIGRKAKLPAFFLFIGILGGIKVYGVLGILFGPIVVTLVTAFVQIYRDEFANK